MVTKQMKETTQVECILVKGDTTYIIGPFILVSIIDYKDA